MPDFSTYAWNELAPATRPSARWGHAMVWDGSRIIMFGGGSAGPIGVGDNNETWEFVAGNWNQLSPAASPSARKGHSMIWDGTRVILHGGASAASGGLGLQDTWKFEAGNWTNITPGGTKPPVRVHHLAVWDGTRMIIYGGQTGSVVKKDTWKFEAGAWTQLTPANYIVDVKHGSPGFGQDGRAGMRSVWDGARVLVFSGYSDAGGGGEFQTKPYYEAGGGTWQYASSNWTQVGPVTNPKARWAQGICVTDDDQKVLMYGGNDSFVGGLGNSHIGDTWQYDGIDWELLTLTGPPARDTAMVWDDDEARALIFGGRVGNAGAEVNTNETWEFAAPLVPVESEFVTIRHEFGAH